MPAAPLKNRGRSGRYRGNRENNSKGNIGGNSKGNGKRKIAGETPALPALGLHDRN